MSTTKIIAALAATAMVGLFTATAYAESIPQEEINQYSGSDKPDVDAGASKGSDESIVKQEQNQFGNEPADLSEGRSEKGGASLPTPDIVGTLNLSATAGKVALVSGTTALSGQCPTGDDGRSGSDSRSDISEPSDQCTLRVSNGRRRHECRSRDRWIVRHFRCRAVIMTELPCDRLLARQQAELGAVETRAEQILNGVFEVLGGLENRHDLARPDGVSGHACLLPGAPHRHGRSRPLLRRRSFRRER